MQSQTIGLDYKTYLKLLIKDKNFNDVLSKLINSKSKEVEDCKIIANELISISCLSKDGLSNQNNIIKNNFDLVTADLDTVSKINIEVSNSLMKMNTFKGNNNE